MSNVMCPACGSKSVEQLESIQSVQLTLAPEFDVKVKNYVCSVCGEEGDFNLENEQIVNTALKEAQKIFVKVALTELEEAAPLVGIERALEIPFRTLNRWKSGDFSSTSVVLLRILKTYPWIINVAENRFNKDVAIKYMYQASLQSVSTYLVENKLKMSVEAMDSNLGSATAKINIESITGGAIPLKMKVV